MEDSAGMESDVREWIKQTRVGVGVDGGIARGEVKCVWAGDTCGEC